MKNRVRKTSDLVSPRQQRNWDWRAAANFIAGGAGGGLLLLASITGAPADATRMAILLALLLIGGGLACVWFEIGRPWRALNVYRHFASSWMTREAVVALGVFGAGGLAFLTGASALIFFAGVPGLAFLYSQARILAANKGIPAWRHPYSISLMIATGLAEGAGLLVCVLSLSSAGADVALLASLIALVVIRALFWKRYLGALVAEGAPEGTLRVLGGIAPKLLLVGHVLPVLAIVVALAGMPGRTMLVFAGGILVVAGGWFMKFTLVRRAAFTQGLALLHLPVRGQGAAGAATKPGWRVASGVKTG